MTPEAQLLYRPFTELMRIAHYAPNIWDRGGVATYIRRLGTAQKDRGHMVAYLSPTPADASEHDETYLVEEDRDLFDRADALNLDVLHLHKSVETVPENHLRTVRTMHGHQASCPSASRYLSRPGRPCNRTPGILPCTWGHFVDQCGQRRPSVVASNFSRFRHEIRFATKIDTITVSDFLRERMIDAGCPPDQVQTLHSPAPTVDDPVVPIPRTGDPRFLFLGRLVPEKGIPGLLRAFRQVPSSARLDVAGDGPLMDEATTFVETHDLEDQVTFHGWRSPDEIGTLLQRARAVLFPSVWHEPAGLVSLEAAAYGRALIATQVGGIPEYAGDEYALLVPPNDVSGLADAITTLATDADRAEALGKRGRTVMKEHFSMTDFLNQLHAFYDGKSVEQSV